MAIFLRGKKSETYATSTAPWERILVEREEEKHLREKGLDHGVGGRRPAYTNQERDLLLIYMQGRKKKHLSSGK